MRCKKCGKRLKRNEKFCTICGYYNGESTEWDEEPEVDLLKDNPADEPKEENKEINEFDLKANASGTKDNEFYYENEDLLEAYIGEDYKLIKKSPFNIYAFLLNWSYLLYRKLYITGIIGLIITAIIILNFSSIFIPYLIITLLVLGFGFNFYYVFVAKKKVEYYKNKSEDKDKFSLLNLCEEKGGVNWIIALIIYFIFLLIIFFSLVRINVNSGNSKFFKENAENKATCNSIVKTSYEDMDSHKIPGQVYEAVCKVSKSNFTEYSIYIKTVNNNVYYYTYYQTENDQLLYKNNTSNISNLEIKEVRGTLTDEEKSTLNTLKQMENNYNDIRKESEKEEELIEKKKNSKERLNYVFTREEVIR